MQSSDERQGGLARYVVAATLARTSDGGAVVGVVLLVTTVGGPPWAAGLLGACITFPHLIGPFIARVLDTARDGRNVLALACILHAATLAAAVVLYDVVWIGIPAILLIASGALGPLLTGGISSRLPAIAGPEREMQRRAQGWDVATYGIGGTVGPTVVAVIAAAWNPTTAVLVLASSAAFAAFLVKMLPPSTQDVAASDVPRPLRTLSLMISSGPLRRTLYSTIAIALSVAVLPVVAVAGTTRFDVAPAAAGFLTAAYGLGSFAGSVGVMVRPLRGDADKAMPVLAACVGVSLFGVFVSGHIGWVIAAYALTGILNSYFFAATLAARSEYAPVAARSQVFVWVGALKITAGSLGTAAAGTLIALDAWLPVILASAVAVTSAGVATIDRLSSRSGKGSES
ncbi:MFS transporter [Microbacterium sp. NPDC089696]|uniref:MFS transporter n=1 Tax=Microbacterium sp. NPDC089696 TaxID=3364199 RepID=UPI00382E3948